MKNHFRSYAVIWAILFALFNAVVFLARPVLPGYEVRYDARFWIAWAFIAAAFLGNLLLSYIALKPENLQKVFYRLPLISVSRTAVIALTVLGCVFMLIPNFPAWVTAIVCVLVFGCNALAVAKTCWAVGAVEAVDEKVKAKTAFIKNLTVNAEMLVSRAKSDSVKAACKKVYEAVRYSDPTSDAALGVLEAEITVKMDALSAAVGADDAQKAETLADALTLLVEERNKKCKLLK